MNVRLAYIKQKDLWKFLAICTKLLLLLACHIPYQQHWYMGGIFLNFFTLKMIIRIHFFLIQQWNGLTLTIVARIYAIIWTMTKGYGCEICHVTRTRNQFIKTKFGFLIVLVLFHGSAWVIKICGFRLLLAKLGYEITEALTW